MGPLVFGRVELPDRASPVPGHLSRALSGPEPDRPADVSRLCHPLCVLPDDPGRSGWALSLAEDPGTRWQPSPHPGARPAPRWGGTGRCAARRGVHRTSRLGLIGPMSTTVA